MKNRRVVRGAKSAPGRSAYPPRDAAGGRRPKRGIALPRVFTRRRGAAWVRPAYRRRARRRRRLLTPLAAVAILLLAAGAIWRLSTRLDSVVVLARREMPSMPEFFYQEDPAWSADTLGTSGRTLGKDGDEVACLASLMAMQSIPSPVSDDLNPGTLNAWLSENDAYDSNGGLNWARVAALLNARAVEKRPQRGLDALMEQLIQSERYPILRVRRPDTGAGHYVLAVGTVHGEFVIVDPLDPTGIPNSLSLYENRIYGLRYLEEH